MDSLLARLILFGLVAALANVIGGAILFPSGLHSRSRRFLKYLLALGAGFMLAVTLLEILPKTILLWQDRIRHPRANFTSRCCWCWQVIC